MAHFDKGGAARTPFGKNAYLRSTHLLLTESYTFAKAGIPTVTIDGDVQKVLQPGTVCAEITAVGVDQGKIGVYDTTAIDGRQTLANIVGIVDTFLPWELLERDAPVSIVYGAAVIQAWCFQYTAGVRATLADATRDDMKTRAKFANLVFWAA